MQYRLQREIDKLKQSILTLGALVEERVNDAVLAVTERDTGLARRLLESDYEIDEMEVDLEEECLKLLALHQPVATDLRFIIATMKINNDLERIGDLVANICERGLSITAIPKTKVQFNLAEMSQQVKRMLKMSLDALVKMDTHLAREVCTLDDSVDEMNREMYAKVEKEISLETDQKKVGQMMHLLSISRHLERIADLTTNISEDVIYMIEGWIIRHKSDEYINKQ
ncbi:phosphate signaling complex protein PhoU [bacterium]|nr:phosphate signaling complex protein PhoU [bacterium]